MMNNYIIHAGIPGQKWGIRRYQYKDGSLTPEGKERYGYSDEELRKDTDRYGKIAANRIKRNIVYEHKDKHKVLAREDKQFEKKVIDFKSKKGGAMGAVKGGIIGSIVGAGVGAVLAKAAKMADKNTSGKVQKDIMKNAKLGGALIGSIIGANEARKTEFESSGYDIKLAKNL